jgi:hypothetical protein
LSGAHEQLTGHEGAMVPDLSYRTFAESFDIDPRGTPV